MKRFFSIVVTTAAFFTLGFAQQNTTVVAQEEKQLAAGPQMAFEMETIDYGVIEQGSDPYRLFKFTNTGTEPLIIKYAKGSCGCTVPTYPKEPISAGESSEIKVRYDTNRIGRFTKRVTLTTNIDGPQKILTIKGEVKKKAEEEEAIPGSEKGLFNNNSKNNNN